MIQGIVLSLDPNPKDMQQTEKQNSRSGSMEVIMQPVCIKQQ